MDDLVFDSPCTDSCVDYPLLRVTTGSKYSAKTTELQTCADDPIGLTPDMVAQFRDWMTGRLVELGHESAPVPGVTLTLDELKRRTSIGFLRCLVKSLEADGYVDPPDLLRTIADRWEEALKPKPEPTPEPAARLAVVKDADGVVRRRGVARPELWFVPVVPYGGKSWSDLPQPVTILRDGLVDGQDPA